MLRFIILLLAMLGASQAALANSLAQDEAAIERHITFLSDPSEKVRADAARALRKIVRRYPSRTVNIRWRDGGEAFWREKIKRIQPGMMQDQAKSILRWKDIDGFQVIHDPVTNAYAQLDWHWVATFRTVYKQVDSGAGQLRGVTTILDRPKLIASGKRFDVPAPKGYTGRWTNWFASGQESMQTDLLGGKENGVRTYYYSNGRKLNKISFKKGVHHGLSLGWYEDGKPEHRIGYRQGESHGKRTFWYPNGRKDRESYWINGKSQLGGRSWHENGRTASIQQRTKVKGEYKVTSWYPSGQKRLETTYFNGLEHGVRAEWNENGVLLFRNAYRNGKDVPLEQAP